MARPVCPQCHTLNDTDATHCFSCGEPLATAALEQAAATAVEAQSTAVTAVEKAVVDGLQAMLDEQRQQTEHLKRLGRVGQILLVLMVLGITLMCVAWVLGAIVPGL